MVALLALVAMASRTSTPDDVDVWAMSAQQAGAVATPGASLVGPTPTPTPTAEVLGVSSERDAVVVRDVPLGSLDADVVAGWLEELGCEVGWAPVRVGLYVAPRPE